MPSYLLDLTKQTFRPETGSTTNTPQTARISMTLPQTYTKPRMYLLYRGLALAQIHNRQTTYVARRGTTQITCRDVLVTTKSAQHITADLDLDGEAALDLDPLVLRVEPDGRFICRVIDYKLTKNNIQHAFVSHYVRFDRLTLEAYASPYNRPRDHTLLYGAPPRLTRPGA